jgi:hypothetical protein
MLVSEFDAASNRAELVRATKPGRGVVLVLLTLPQYRERRASCRTLHYFYQVKR